MSKKLDKKKQLLSSLTGAALLLPGIALANSSQTNSSNNITSSVTSLQATPTVASEAGSQNDTLYSPLLVSERARNPVQNVFLDVMYGNHTTDWDYVNNEADSDTFFGHIEIPLSDSQDLDITFIRDVTTSATPVFYRPSGSDVSQVTTQASVVDRRNALNVKTTHYGSNYSVSVNGGFSDEDDYTSVFTGLKTSIDMNSNNTTLTLGASYAHDDSDPVSNPPFIRTGGTSNKQEYLLGITQVFTPRFVMAQNLYYGYESGYLSDPYKLVWITPPPPGFSPVVNDTRPNTRRIFALTTQALYYFGSPALDIHYRYYRDDWGIHSHTFNTKLKIPIGGSGWTVIPGVRYYTQSAADFYSLYFTEIPSDGYWSSDYRLAGFGEIGAQLEISKEFQGGFLAYAGYEYIYRNKTLHLFHTPETQPEESKFTKLTMNVFYIGIQKVF